ncbi:MAG: hypothetical protein EOO14_21465, partial [Chitinophagaceae bacterium]
MAQPTVSGLLQGSYVFSLVVTDNLGGISAADQVTISVNATQNVNPTANAGADQTITLPLSQVQLQGSGTDPDGTIAGYQWSQLSGPSQAVFSSQTVAQPTVSSLVQGSYVFALTVTDNLGAISTTDEVTFTVNAAINVLPSANAGADQTITLPLAQVQLQGSGTDPDGTISAYQWSQISGPNSAIFSNSTIPQPTVSGLLQGSYVFSLVVTDNLGGISAADQVTITVNAASTTQAVVSFTLMNADNEQGILMLTNGQTLNLANLPTRNLNIRANTSPSLVGSIVFNLSGKQIRNATETSSPYALFGDANGNYNAWTPALGSYTLKATPYSGASGSGTAGSQLVVSFTVIDQSAPPANLQPTASAGADQTITLPANEVLLQGSGTDPDGTIAAHQWTQVSGPSQAVFSSHTVAQPTVSSLVQGSYVFALTVTDNLGATSA